MARPALVLDVLIASPSDVSEARDAVESVILEWNAANRTGGVVLRPVRWERDAAPALGGTPQSILNAQFVDACDFGIAIFGQRIGTPTAEAPSGTVEEIRRLHYAGKRVLVYFLDPDEPAAPGDEAAGQQRAALAAYRAELQRRGRCSRGS